MGTRRAGRSLGWALGGALRVCVAVVALSGCGRSTFQSGELGAPCLSDALCQEGLVCLEGFCRLGDDGGANNGPGPSPTPCDRGLVTCLGASTRGVCGPDGYAPEPCPGGAVCEGGACVSAPTCEDGARICDGPGAVLVCEGGVWGERAACRSDQRCSDGLCQRVTQAADIRVDAVTFSPSVLQRTSDALEVVVDVENVGERWTGSFSCGVLAVDVFTRDAYPVQEFRVTTLEPGVMAREITSGGTLLPPSRYEVTALCDTFDEVDEIDEGNNMLAARQLLEVLEPVEDEVDLELQFFNVFPNRVLRDGVIQVEYQVVSFGPGPLEVGYACDVYLERGALELGRAEPVASWSVEVALFPFESFFDVQPVDLPVEVLPGAYNAYLRCAPLEQPDPILGNNLLELAQRVEVDDLSAAPDLVVAEVFVDSAVIEPDEALEVYTLICNQGTTGVSGATVAYLLFEDPFGGGLLDDEIALFDIGPMGPGSCEEFFVRTRPVACFEAVEEQELFVQASIRQVFGPPEVNINNNFLTAFTPAVLRGCDEALACEPDLFDLIDELVEVPQGFPLSLCAGDADVFVWSIEEGREAELRVDVGAPFEPVVVTVEVDLGSAAREPLLASQVLVSPATLRVEREAALGTYYVSVVSASGADVREYSLSWRYTDGPQEGADLVGEVEVEPRDYAPGGPLAGALVVQNVGDAATEASFVARLRLQDAAGEVWALGDVLGPEGLGEGELLGLSLSDYRVPEGAAPGPAELLWIVDVDDTVEERDEGNNTASAGLVIAQEAPCGDAFDPNNRQGDAAEIAPGEYDLQLCLEEGVPSRTQGDFFRVCPEPGTALEVVVRFDGERNDVDLLVESDDGQQRESSISTGDMEDARIEPTRAGQCYTVQVYLFGARVSDAPYTMELDYVPLDTGGACADADEPNGTFGEAFEVEAGRSYAFELCQVGGESDVDIFAVSVPEGVGALNVSVVAPPDQAPGAFALGVYDAQERFITQRFAAAIDASVEVSEPGVYYLRLVTASDAEAFRYDLSVSFDDGP